MVMFYSIKRYSRSKNIYEQIRRSVNILTYVLHSLASDVSGDK